MDNYDVCINSSKGDINLSVKALADLAKIAFGIK